MSLFQRKRCTKIPQVKSNWKKWIWKYEWQCVNHAVILHKYWTKGSCFTYSRVYCWFMVAPEVWPCCPQCFTPFHENLLFNLELIAKPPYSRFLTEHAIHLVWQNTWLANVSFGSRLGSCIVFFEEVQGCNYIWIHWTIRVQRCFPHE